MKRAQIIALVLALTSVGVIAQGAAAPVANAAAPQLTRYPYLTDVVQTFATVNWGTDRSQTKGTVKFGRVGQESCTAHTVSASKTSITVNGIAEYQWKAKLSNLVPNAQYCYRIFLGTTDLLGAGTTSPEFWSQIPAGDPTPYSFAVFGDWGDTDPTGDNPQQAALMSSVANSGVRFALGTGDTGYANGTQTNYGDLQQTGHRVSSIFGPNFWAQAGDTVPLFNAVGNHGMNATFFNNWPQNRAVANSGGTYAMETYCCQNGASSQKSPSAWYAFDVGNARFYMLTTVWGATNVGSSNDYGMDYAYRWQQSSAEYQWLQNDLQSHPSQLKFAVFHYPLYVDNPTEPSDTFLRGANSLEGLLTDNGVNMVFNGHAHLYERNNPTSAGLVTYVTGGGGAIPEPISGCQSYDAYGLGWSQTTGGSKCGSAVKPTQVEQVFHYLKVDVSGTQVTVAGVNALGQTFDSKTYDFGDETNPSAPTNLQANAPSGTQVNLTWGASSDANGIQAYDIYRDGSLIDSVNGSTTTYSDLTVGPNTPYAYVVKARDPVGNTSDPSNTANVTTPSASFVFEDDFESGSLAAWTFVDGLTVSQGIPSPSGGQWVGRETTSCCKATYAYKSISPTVTEAYARFRFQVIGRSGSVDLMRFRNGSGGSKFSLLVDSGTGSLATRNAAGTTTKSTAVIQNGTWYTVEVHVKIGTPSVTEVWLDGSPVAQLSNTGDLGTTNFGQFLLGQTSTTGTYDVAFDDVIVSKNFI